MAHAEHARERITVLLAIAVRLYREGLAVALGAQGSMQVHATAGPPGDVLAAARALQPHVVIVDVSPAGALDLMRDLRTERPAARILAFAVGEEIDRLLAYADAGADGFFNSNGSLPELVDAIEQAAQGGLPCSPGVAAQLLRHAVHRAMHPVQHGPAGHLTSREREVFELLQKGRSNKEIASALHIAEATVKNHVHHVLAKMHVATRGKAAAVRESRVRD
jgi:two-component system, NarL family, nitrate/nitrite response regulator NarL